MFVGETASIHWRFVHGRAEFDESLTAPGWEISKTTSTARRYSAFERKLVQNNTYVCD